MMEAGPDLLLCPAVSICPPKAVATDFVFCLAHPFFTTLLHRGEPVEDTEPTGLLQYLPRRTHGDRSAPVRGVHSDASLSMCISAKSAAPCSMARSCSAPAAPQHGSLG